MHFVKAKTILSAKNGMNIYRGCSHGCIYCDSRSSCYNFTHDFEDIEVKENAPLLLEQALQSKRSKCMIGTGSMSDPYMHCEDELQLTRKCLQLIDRYGFGATVITKSNRILRDLDLIKSINEKSKFVVQMTLTTFDDELCKILEPNVCTTSARFDALKTFRDSGIPTVVWLTPILPFINDTEENLNGILDYCIEAEVKGIICFGMGVTLREGDREYFYQALNRHFPGMARRYHEKYGYAYNLLSDNHYRLMEIFKSRCREAGIMSSPDECFTYLNQFSEKYEQLSMF